MLINNVRWRFLAPITAGVECSTAPRPLAFRLEQRTAAATADNRPEVVASRDWLSDRGVASIRTAGVSCESGDLPPLHAVRRPFCFTHRCNAAHFVPCVPMQKAANVCTCSKRV